MKLVCGCIPDASGYGYCGECTRLLREKIWRKMPEAKRAYDRKFAPEESRKLDEAIFNDCCSCHINPPCSFCTNQGEENE